MLLDMAAPIVDLLIDDHSKKASEESEAKYVGPHSQTGRRSGQVGLST